MIAVYVSVGNEMSEEISEFQKTDAPIHDAELPVVSVTPSAFKDKKYTFEIGPLHSSIKSVSNMSAERFNMMSSEQRKRRVTFASPSFMISALGNSVSSESDEEETEEERWTANFRVIRRLCEDDR